MARITSDWYEILEDEFQKEYFKELMTFIEHEYMKYIIYPTYENIYAALELTPYSSVKVVILGQDPYHNEGQAHGLSFSVGKEVAIPPSLVNIYKELKQDIGCNIPEHGCLKDWAKQGVLLLNTVLTVRAHEPNSHQNKGWEIFTDEIIKKLNEKEEPIVFILWGKPASKKKKLLNNPNHLILEAPHPSPLSSYRGFFDSKPFSKSNEFLKSKGETIINWEIH